MPASTTRRAFLGSAAAAGLGMPLIARAPLLPAPRRKLSLLILGGTSFLGPATIEAAQRRGHEMTMFNRGRTNPQLFPDVEKLHGDRDGKLDALAGRKWDAVIDTSGYVPRHARLSAEMLRDAVRQYVFVSTISVYPDFGNGNGAIDEDSAVGVLDDPSVEEVNGATYGPLKALCEQAVEAVMPGRVTNVRPGLIVGPGDPSDRFTYWPLRVHRGGEILAPGDGTTTVQFIDVRDLGEWIIAAIENEVTGVYNATGFQGRLDLREFLYGCKCAITTDCSFTWLSEQFLAAKGVGPWMEMPLWIPAEALPYVKNERALAKGLRFRPVSQTIADTLEWALEKRGKQKLRAGMDAARETELLASWHDAQKAK